MARLRAIHAYIARDSVSHADAMIDRVVVIDLAHQLPKDQSSWTL